MALQTSGAISLQQVNVELGKTSTAQISLNDTAVRTLLGKPSGTISMQDAYGKANEIRYTNTARITNVNIYTLMGSPTAVANYIFENNSEINANTAAYALRTGVFPAGSTLTIVNNGYIYGRGGIGSSAVDTPGEAGGDAIYLDMPCRVDNTNGYILAGGGGGGSARRQASYDPYYYILAGGGGGAGSVVSSGGSNSYYTYNNQFTTNTPSQAQGTPTAGGTGGTITVISGNVNGIDISDSVYGGTGGANGAPGTIGSTVNVSPDGSSYKNIPTIGVAGAAGRAIITNGQTLTQVAGFDSTRVKGAIV